MLTTLLTRDAIRHATDEGSFSRGGAYFRQGAVRRISMRDGVLCATVDGSEAYQVRIGVAEGRLHFSCTCPVDAVCKHCVAVALEYLQNPERASEGASQDALLEDYLRSLDKDALIGVILEATETDQELRQALLLCSANNSAAFRQALDSAIRFSGYVEYSQVYRYSQAIEQVVDQLETWLTQETAEQVSELCEYGLRLMEEAIQNVDDSDGYLGGIMGSLQELHLRACLLAKPDPVALAERLFDWEMNSEWDTFYGSEREYGEVFGSEGIARYRELAEEHWADLPERTGGDYDPHRRRLSDMMESLARQSGDIVALVEVMKKDLTNSERYLRIARVFEECGDPPNHLHWLEEGVRAFPNDHSRRLQGELAAAYHQRGRHDDAMEIAWKLFSKDLTIGGYVNLSEEARKAGLEDDWRSRAVEMIRADVKKRWNPDQNDLVRIFLFEQDGEQAWQEALKGNCSSEIWLRLAAMRKQDHPEDAIGIYKRVAENAIEQKNNSAYEEAIDHLRELKSMMDSGPFDSFVASLRAKNRQKRNLMKMIADAGW